MAEFEWYSSNTQISYPFEDFLAGNLHELFVDAYIIHNKKHDKHQRVKLVLWDPPHIKLEFEDGTTLLDLNFPDPDLSFVGPTVFGRYSLYEWKKFTTMSNGFTGEEACVRFVVLSSLIPQFGPPLTPTSAFLLSSLVCPQILHVRKIAVKQPGIPLPIGGGFADGAVVFEAGNNMSIQISPPAATLTLGLDEIPVLRPPTPILIDAIPGAGTGVFRGCTDPILEIKKFNEMVPDADGNLRLDGQACTWVERPIGPMQPAIHPNTDYLSNAIPASLVLHDDCKACCDCVDYKDAYEGIARIWARGLELAAHIETLRKRYEELVTLINARSTTACPTNVNIDLTVVARPDFHLAIGVSLVNNTENTLNATVLQFCISPGSFVYTEGSGALNTELVHGAKMDPMPSSCISPLQGGGLTVTLPPMAPKKVVNYSFEVRYYAGTARLNAPASVMLEVNTAEGPTVVTRTTLLRPPLRKT